MRTILSYGYGTLVFLLTVGTCAPVLSACGSSEEEGTLSLRSVEPREGTARGGDTLTLRGSGFDGSTRVHFGDVSAASVKVLSADELQVVTPLHLAGAVDVKASGGSSSATLPKGFAFQPLVLSFREAPPWYLPIFEHSLSDAVAGDFDGDGHMDLLVAVRNRAAMLLFNGGNGSFVGANPPVEGPDGGTADADTLDAETADAGAADSALPEAGPTKDAGASPNDTSWAHDTRRLLAADIDGDGDLDVILCNRSGQAHQLMINDGKGTFSRAPNAFPETADECRDAVLVDVDGDSLLDLVVLGGGKVGAGKSYVRVYLQAAGGSTPTFAIATALEEDADAGASCGSVKVSPGEASAAAKTMVTTTAQGNAACQVEFDTAGADASIVTWFSAPSVPFLPDAVVLDLRAKSGTQNVSVLVRDAGGEVFAFDAGAIGDSSWKRVRADKLGTWSSEGEAGDGVIDLPIAAVGVSVLPGSGTTGALLMDGIHLDVPAIGTVHLDDFERKDFKHSWGVRMSSLAAGDLDGDALPDLLIGSDEAGDHAQLVLLRNNTSGSVGFRTMASGALDALPDPIAATLLLDGDGDGDLDIVVGALAGQDRYLSNDGKGYLFDDTLAMMPVDRVDARYLSSADLDLDGRPDLLVANDGAVDRIYVSRGASGFRDVTPAIPLKVGKTLRLIPFDADGDGDTDIFVLGEGAEPSVLLVSVKESR
jgi:hypothetical protein